MVDKTLRAAPSRTPIDERAVQETLDVVQQLRSDYAERDKLYEEIDKVVYNQIAPEIPEAYKKQAAETRLGLAGHMVNTITSALCKNPPKSHFAPVARGLVGQENATTRERYFDASFLRQEDEADQELYRQFMYNLVAKGEAIFKTLERTKVAWSGYSAYSKKLLESLDDPALEQEWRDKTYDARTEEWKRGQPYPIRTESLLPETFYCLKGADGIPFACEVKQVPYFDTLERYGVGMKGDRVVPAGMAQPRTQAERAAGTARMLTMIEAWDPKYVTYVLQGPGQSLEKTDRGVCVKRIRHKYGNLGLGTLRGPYFQARGVTTASRLPEYAGLGVLFGWLDLFPLLNAYMTMESQIAFFYGFPSWKRKLPPGGMVPDEYGKDGTEKDAIDKLEPGAVYPFDIEAVGPPRGVELVHNMIAVLRGFTDIILPPIMRGATAGVDSGYEFNQAAYLTQLAWDPLIKNAQRTMGRRTGFESYLISEVIGEKVYVWGDQGHEQGKRRKPQKGWLGIGPDDLGTVHRYTVKMDASTPSNKAIELRIHKEAVDANLERWEDAVEAMGNNPDEVELSNLVRAMKGDPAIQEQFRQRVLQELATIQAKDADKAARALQPQQGGAPAGGALGNVGAVVQPGYGMPMTPTPQGSVGGLGPGGNPGLPPGNPAGMAPGVAGPPQNAEPLQVGG